MLIRGGTVWTERGPVAGDVLVRDGRIAAVGDTGVTAEPDILDAAGFDVLPGLVDVHVHLDDEVGGHPIADSFATGSAAALCSGITTIASFVTQRRSETLSEAIARMAGRVTAGCHTDAVLHLTPTRGRWDWDETARLSARGFRTFKLYTTYREAGLYISYDKLEAVMRRLADLGARLLVHCEDETMLAAAAAGSLDWSDPVTHAQSRPEEAEVAAIRRVAKLAGETGCPTHVVHVSTTAGVALLKAVRRHAPLTFETAPQYLLLSEEALANPGGHRLLCTPPLRPELTRGRLEAAAVAGAFDLYATDHCPFTRTDKDAGAGDIRSVPKGLPGVGALLPLLYELLVRRRGLPLGELALRLGANPARLLGLYPGKGVIRRGADADLVLVERHGPPRPIRSTTADAWDPWADRETSLAVHWVLLGGERVVRDGELIAPAHPRGRLLQDA